MKITLTSLTSLSRKRAHAGSLRKWRVIYPERDWIAGLVLAGVLFGACAGYAGWLFFSGLKQLETTQVSSESLRSVYDEKRVTRILADYGERTERFEALRAGRKAVVPPAATTTAPEVTQVASTTGDVVQDAENPVE